MSPSGESEDPHALRIYVPLSRVLAQQANSTLRILQRGDRFGKRSSLRHAILHEHTIYRNGVQPVTDLGSLQVDRHDAITSAGKDHDCRSRIAVRRSGI